MHWEGKKMAAKVISASLGLRDLNSSSERVQKIVFAFRDKLKVAVIKRKIQRKERLARWVV